MKNLLLFFILLCLPLIFFVPKTHAYTQDWTVASITEGEGPYGTDGAIVTGGHCSLYLKTSYGGYNIDSTSLCDGNSTAYFYHTFPDGTYYLEYFDRDGIARDSNYFTIQNGLIVNDNATPDTKPAPNYPSTPEVTVYGIEGTQISESLADANVCDSIGWDIYNISNELIEHIDSCSGVGEVMNIQNPLADGGFYIYGYVKSPAADNFISLYSNKFYILGGKFYSNPFVLNPISNVNLNRGDTYSQNGSFIDVSPG